MLGFFVLSRPEAKATTAAVANFCRHLTRKNRGVPKRLRTTRGFFSQGGRENGRENGWSPGHAERNRVNGRNVVTIMRVEPTAIHWNCLWHVYEGVEYRELAQRQTVVMNGAIMTIIHRVPRHAYEKLRHREATSWTAKPWSMYLMRHTRRKGSKKGIKREAGGNDEPSTRPGE